MASVPESAVRWVFVAQVSDVSPGQVRRVEVEGWVLAVVNLRGKFYALHGVCPHQGGPLAEGELWNDALECPWHHFHFDLETGRNLYPANVYPDDMPELRQELRPARVFAVKVRDNRVFVALPVRTRG